MTTTVNTPNDFRLMLKPGEIRTYTCPDSGATVKVFSVAGGSFTRCDTRTADGAIVAALSGTWMYETTALDRAAMAVQALQADALERAAAS